MRPQSQAPDSQFMSSVVSLSSRCALKSKVALGWFFRRGKSSQIRQNLHLMAISAKGKSTEQALLVIHPFDEDLLHLVWGKHCVKYNEEYKDEPRILL